MIWTDPQKVGPVCRRIRLEAKYAAYSPRGMGLAAGPGLWAKISIMVLHFFPSRR